MILNKFIWDRRSRIFSIDSLKGLNLTHSQVPYYVKHNGKEYIYFTSRPPRLPDGNYVSYVLRVEVEYIGEGAFHINSLPQEPLLKLGDYGSFDETGTMPCSVIDRNDLNEVWLYYVGWSNKRSVPFDCAIGLAISKDNGQTFNKYSEGPILGQNKNDKFLIGCPRVYFFNSKWYLFYISGVSWESDANGKREAHYRLKCAISNNGIDWETNNMFIIEEKFDIESQTCPSVFFKDGLYHMFFTYRYTTDFRNPDRGYRIGYAFSNDLINWQRRDDLANFDVSDFGTIDNEMVCYPNINLISEEWIMLYCGNEFGKYGFNSVILR